MVNHICNGRSSSHWFKSSLGQHQTYRIIPAHTTIKQKERLINLLKNIKAEGGNQQQTYKKIYPTGTESPKFYGMPKTQKTKVPLRPIVSRRGIVTHETAIAPARILQPLVGKSLHNVHNIRDFIQQTKGIKLEDDECISAYDMNLLFTSVPIEPVLKITKKQLEQDRQLHQRTTMICRHHQSSGVLLG